MQRSNFISAVSWVWSDVAPQVTLYAEFEPDRLLPFLTASQSYPLEPALRVCQEQGLVREQVRPSDPTVLMFWVLLTCRA